VALLARLTESEKLHSRAGVVIGLGVVVALLYWARLFFITFFSAVAIAFILEPFVTLLMRVRFPRNLASFVVCSTALLVVYLLGMGAYAQISDLLDNVPKYSQRIGALADETRARIEQVEKRSYDLIMPSRRQAQQPAPEPPATKVRRRRAVVEPAVPTGPPPIQEVRVLPERTPLVDYLYSRLGSVYQILLMISFVPFLVYFMLSWRDHIHRSFLQFFSGEDRMIASKSLQGIADMVRGFVVGNFVLGLLLAGASSLAFWKLGLPYSGLIGPISGFLSLVPYVGLPLALAPPMFFALTVFTTISGYLLVIAVVSVFHVLTLNLLYPKLVGSRVHLNPLVVTVALMIWGFLWDAAGLILAIPLTAGIKAVCDNVKELRPFGKFLGD
jgi:predicted PurR-regulated permease PerM